MEYAEDMRVMAEKVNAADPDITIYRATAGYREELPAQVWEKSHPDSVDNPDFLLPIRRGTILRNEVLSKIEQQTIFRKHAIPAPPAAPFSFGLKLDPILFGDFVILKPLDIMLQSKGEGIYVMRRARVEQLTAQSFASGHPIHRPFTYMVQKFIPTGDYAKSYRVSTYLAAVLYALIYQAKSPSPPLTSPDHVLDTGDFTQKHDRSVVPGYEDDVLELARKVAAAFATIPLLAIDIIRDVRTSKLYVLEVNPGGNTWHFSSRMWAERRQKEPELIEAMKKQFGAFDVAARALLESTHRLAT